GGIILWRDDHDPGAPFNGLQFPMGFRHLVLDEVLAPARAHLGETHVGEVAVGPLDAEYPRMRRVLIPVPGIVRQIAPTLRLFRTDLPDPDIQQRIDAPVQPGVAKLADHTENWHPCAMLKRPSAGPLHHLDHLRRIALLPE